jgi:hypothetical protein
MENQKKISDKGKSFVQKLLKLQILEADSKVFDPFEEGMGM